MVLPAVKAALEPGADKEKLCFNRRTVMSAFDPRGGHCTSGRNCANGRPIRRFLPSSAILGFGLFDLDQIKDRHERTTVGVGFLSDRPHAPVAT